jgi:hypothetical protein
LKACQGTRQWAAAPAFYDIIINNWLTKKSRKGFRGWPMANTV